MYRCCNHREQDEPPPTWMLLSILGLAGAQQFDCSLTEQQNDTAITSVCSLLRTQPPQSEWKHLLLLIQADLFQLGSKKTKVDSVLSFFQTIAFTSDI
jgi:hypothetical protein